jgi:hypothetical protein
MAYRISRVEYFTTTVKDKPGEAYRVLAVLEELGIHLLAINLVSTGPMATQVTMIPADPEKLRNAAKYAKLALVGPRKALMVQGDEVLGALVGIHSKLAAANVNVFASNGVTDGESHYCYILHVRPEEYERAAKALEI